MSSKEEDQEEGSGGARIAVIFVVLAALLAVVYVAAGRRSHEEPAPSAPELPPPPPCIDNRCVERPGYLDCIEWSNGYPASCSKWKILYENNCVCHEWGPRELKLDGGTP